MKNRVVIIDVVGLSPAHFRHPERMPNIAALLAGGRLFRMRPVFPAVTLPAQASLTTGVHPETHGVVANGFYFPDRFQVGMWEQPASLVEAERIWERIARSAPESRTAALFLQNCLYAPGPSVITPRPIHSDEGLIQWCYSKPVGLYEEISERIGEFDLRHYWGPMTSIESSRWIAGAAVETLARIDPHLLLVYLPHLDYCSQKLGPDDPQVLDELVAVDAEAGRIIDGVADLGLSDRTTFVILSEYAFSAVRGAVPINRVLRENGLLRVRTIRGREYLDMELSPAFALVDHQAAHLYVKPGHAAAVRQVLERTEGIDHLLDSGGQARHRVGHRRSGEFVAVSARDRWFSYPWWEDPGREPDFAGRVDIHRKPGYDPLELFLEPGTREISRDTSLIRGSHGYPPMHEGDDLPLLISGAGAASLEIPDQICLTDVAGLVESVLERGGR